MKLIQLTLNIAKTGTHPQPDAGLGSKMPLRYTSDYLLGL